MTDVGARLWRRVTKGPDCWLWDGPVRGSIQRGRRGEGKVRAHVLAYELLVGPVPEGCILHHTCENQRCVNPAHLRPVVRGTHPLLHDRNIVAEPELRERGGEIGRCKRWRIVRGLPCICGAHQGGDAS
jgi:hypothetical protein